MKRIESIQLKNIGVFKDQLIEFSTNSDPNKAEIHIFTGINGSGKTTVLEGLISIFSKNPKAILLKRGESENSFIEIKFNSIPAKITSKEISNYASLNFHKFNRYTDHFTYNKYKKLDFSAFAYAGNRMLIHSKDTSISNKPINPLHGALSFESNSSPSILQWIANAITKQALSAMRGDHQKSKKYGEIIQTIENIISEVAGLSIKFELLDNPLEVVVKHNDQKIGFDVLSDGLKSLISWIADLLLRLEQLPWEGDIPVLERNFILFLDEIEVHLHPSLQRKVLPIVQNLFPNAQIFISTHSPFVVNSVDGAWIYKLKLENGESTISTITESKTGKSINLILDEIFDVDEEFGEKGENLLDRFYSYRNSILAGQNYDKNNFEQLLEELAQQGQEIQDIIARELQQLKRRGNL